MYEQRQELYNQLVSQLLNCPPGEEINLLQANRDLVDLGLFYTIVQRANYFTSQNDPRLNDLNRALIAANGFDSLEEMHEEYFSCLMAILEVVAQNPTPEAVYPLFHRHLDKLNLNLASVLQFGGKDTLAKAEPQSIPAIAEIIFNLAGIIQNFPQGNIANNLEIAIIAYELILNVITEQDFSQNWAATQNNLGTTYLNRIRGDRAENLERAIACFQLDLRVHTEGYFPQAWAGTQGNLGLAYQDRIRGDKRENLEQAIAYYQAALRVHTEGDFPQAWANTQNNLGGVYHIRIQGDKGENLEQAIAYYQAALRVRTERDLPQEWAGTQNNLGNAYRDRIWGDRAENLEQAIAYCQAALRVHTEQDLPQKWTKTQHNLGDAYLYRIRGDRAENLEQAIAYYQAALRVRTEQDLPLDWASTQNSLGLAYQNRIRGDKRENLERAIAYYQQALGVYTEGDLPLDWAGTQNNLGNAYSNRIQGDRRENLELAIDCYYAVLRVYTEQDLPLDWASTQHNLGTTYSDRIHGDRRENLELAIDCYRAALGVYTEQDLPQAWATTQNNLGSAYTNRIQGDRRENLELAIDCYRAALRVRTEADLPLDWAATQNNLGRAYLSRIWGDRAENLELAIGYYQAALRVFTEQDLPLTWAATQNNLGTTYSNRIRGDRAENMEQAIECYQAALQVRTEADLPLDWAAIQNNLGTVYWDRIRGDKGENIERAIEYYQAALRVLTERNLPLEWAMTQSNLGVAYSDRIRGDKAENLELTIEYYHAALRVRIEQDLPLEWAATQNNLGSVYEDRICGDKGENLEEAIGGYQKALRVHTPENCPIECRTTARSLGNLALNMANWKLAIDAYDKGITALEMSRSWAMDDDRRQEIIAKSTDVYMNMVQACINNGDLQKATEYADRARSKQLVELMASNDLYRGGDIPAEMQTYLSQYEDLETRIAHLRRNGESSENRTLPTTETQQLEAEKAELWRQIRRLDPILAGQIQVDPISFRRIQQLIDNNTTAILSFYTTRDDTHIFILYRDLPPQIYTLAGEGTGKLHTEFLRDNWLMPYINDRGKWQQNIPHFLQQLAQRLQIEQIIDSYLGEIEELIIIPHLYLHQIPFAALPLASTSLSQLRDRELSEVVGEALPLAITRQPWDTQNRESLDATEIDPPQAPLEKTFSHQTRDGRAMGGTPRPQNSSEETQQIAPTPCLGDRFRVRILPSCQILSYCHQAPTLPAPATQAIGIVENATGDLPYTAYECETIATRYHIPSSHRLQTSQATATAFRQLAGKVPILHSSHHAGYDPQNPLNSRLRLHDRDLPLSEILTWRIPTLTDIYLNNCETNFSINKIDDNLLTISTAFLCTGAKNVVSTLWSVDDCASALIAIFYYEFRQAGATRSRALQQAQYRLRHLTGAQLKAEYYQQLTEHLQRLLIELKSQPEVDENTIDKIQYQIEKGLLDRCQEAYPFANPYYWAGFISQGLA